MEKFKIVHARSDEIADLKIIEADCGLSEWTVGAYESEYERPDSVILTGRTADDRLVGFLLGRVPLNPNGAAELYNIGTLPQFRRQGVGSLLLEEFRLICVEREIFTIWLEVRSSNYTAIAFYRAHGFLIDGIRPGFYENPAEDAHLMSRSIMKVGEEQNSEGA